MFSGVLTKEYLIKLGVTDVSRDGLHIMKGDKEVTQRYYKDFSEYKIASFYDPDLYIASYKNGQKYHIGNVDIHVHRLVYAWYHGQTTEGLVVDHINNNKLDNSIDNLQELTPGGNAWKDRPHDVYTIKCNLAKPLSYYQDKVEFWKRAFELAKTLNDHREYNRCATKYSQAKARVRYYLQNKPKES